MIGDPRRWGSHWPALFAAVRCTDGPIVEFGAGWGSTPLLAVIRGDRYVLTVETDMAWARKFRDLTSAGHDIEIVGDAARSMAFAREHWSVALVDSLPDEQRPELAERIAKTADVVIVHDVQQAELRPWWTSTRTWPCVLTVGDDPATGIGTADARLLGRIARTVAAIESP